MMPNANNITITTKLSSCHNTSFNFNQTANDLYNIYQDNISNVFLNISINYFNCSRGKENYFNQIIFFTQSVSIRIQILFASIYFDYIQANNYQLNGFIIDQEKYFYLSSITVNNTALSDACSSGEAAQDPFCLTNLTNPLCTVSSSPWNFTCSQTVPSSTNSLYKLSISNNSLFETTTTTTSSRLTSWQLALVCSLSISFILLLICLAAFFYRRHTHSKHLALSGVNSFDDFKSVQNSGIPHGQAFQRATTLAQPKRTNRAISWIHDDNNHINSTSPELYNQVKFIDYAKSPFHTNVSPSLTETPINQVKAIPGSEEDNNQSSKKPSKPLYIKAASIDESLHDEDAWMSILDVVNAELAVLNEEDLIRTVI